MCQTVCWKSKTCNHRWMCIAQKCNQYHQSYSFTATPVHEFRTERTILGRPRYLKAPIGSCPECDKRGFYNHEVIRMVIADGCREFKEVTGMDFNKYSAAMVVNSGRGMAMQHPAMKYPQIAPMPPVQQYLTPWQQQVMSRQQSPVLQSGWPLLTSPYMAAPQTQRALCYLKWTA